MTVTSSRTGSQLGRPVGPNGEQTRQRIIMAAMRCVAEVGYSQSSIQEIPPKYPGSKALRDVVTEIVEDARAEGLLSADTGAEAAVEAVCALTRGLSEQAASLSPQAYDATLDSVKRLLGGTLFARGKRSMVVPQ
ncbi:TetR family transcriptional regulator [Mycobacterium canetti]|uniref:TetR family transcriptional regulator n=1 Tax=Mycobacterium canetti TaxID=78331 RepID=UPI001E61186E|nr:TetR family transcriptional regulator [Mycobacterium canetti]